jgi:hypothetical protein
MHSRIEGRNTHKVVHLIRKLIVNPKVLGGQWGQLRLLLGAAGAHCECAADGYSRKRYRPAWDMAQKAIHIAQIKILMKLYICCYNLMLLQVAARLDLIFSRAIQN